jgi:glycosyltransferase involved in cell wall biosynthesis
MKPSVTILRGPMVNPWELRPWEDLQDRYDIAVLVPDANQFDTGGLALTRVPVRTRRGRLPAGRLGDVAVRSVGDRYLGLADHLRGADIVHAAELGYWFSWQAARLKQELGFQLALTVWETLPLADAYRNVRTRRFRREVLPAVDLFLATTERARQALILEGAPPARIEVSPPGVDVARFAAAREPRPRGDGRHVIVSIGRLVWEKGHQDVIRALGLLRARGRPDVALAIIGVGPEEGRLRAVAADLGLADVVSFEGGVAYDELPGRLAEASCLVLASLPIWSWEEQFGMVLAEAMAAHVPVLASASGAIPEVVGASGTLFMPGDYVGLADALAAGPLDRPPGARIAPEPDRLERFSRGAAARRLAAAYERLLDSS